jgi:hypothetical protein
VQLRPLTGDLPRAALPKNAGGGSAAAAPMETAVTAAVAAESVQRTIGELMIVVTPLDIQTRPAYATQHPQQQQQWQQQQQARLSGGGMGASNNSLLSLTSAASTGSLKGLAQQRPPSMTDISLFFAQDAVENASI